MLIVFLGMNYQSYFSEKKNKNNSIQNKCRLLNFLPRMLRVKAYTKCLHMVLEA